MLVYLQVKFHVCIEDLVATPIVYKCTAPNSRLWNFQCETSGIEHQKYWSHITQKNLEAFRKWMRHETFQHSNLQCWANIIVAVWSCITFSVWFKETSILLNENPKKIEPAEAPNPELDAVHAQLLQVDKVLAFRSKTYYCWIKGHGQMVKHIFLRHEICTGFDRVSVTCCKQAVSRCLMSRHCMAESGE